jgi:miniconductance mechanosensitive channel
MVRYLDPTSKGIPVELYFFSANKNWVPYEGLQSDVLDHVLSVMHFFDLAVFQDLNGEDFKQGKKNS